MSKSIGKLLGVAQQYKEEEENYKKSLSYSKFTPYPFITQTTKPYIDDLQNQEKNIQQQTLFASTEKKLYNNYKLGTLSSSFESKENPATIGYDTTGGYSYGIYQIETKNGTMKDFLNLLSTKQNYQQYAKKLYAAGGFSGAYNKTPNFAQTWNSLAEDPNFIQAQHDFIVEQKLQPLLHNINHIKGLNLEQRHPVIKDVLYSIAVQHGRANLIVKKALGTDASFYTDEEIINNLYQSRIDYVSSLSKMNLKEQYNIIHYRYPQERLKALKYLKMI